MVPDSTAGSDPDVQRFPKAASKVVVAEERALGLGAEQGPRVFYEPSKRLLRASSPATESLVADRGANACYPSPPPRAPHRGCQRSDERESWRYLSSRRKARTSPSILCSLYWRGSTPPKSDSDHPPTHPCSSSGPMARLVLAGTLSISEQQRSDS